MITKSAVVPNGLSAAHNSNTALGRLMKDFLCSSPNEMNYDKIADTARHFKETEQGVTHMCEIMREAHNNSYNAGFITGQQAERAKMEAKKKQQAASMLKDSLSVEKIVKYTDLPLETIQEIADILRA